MIAAALAIALLFAEPDAFRAALVKAIATDTADKGAVRGADGRLFLRSELRHYSVGPFWGDAAAKASIAAKDQDPLPVIVDFHKALAARGIVLIVVPVPGKAVVHADSLDSALKPEPRLDTDVRKFLDRLETEGVATIDLTPDFLKLRAAGTDPFCRTDTHWSPAGMALAAERIDEVLRDKGVRNVLPAAPWKAKLELVAVEARGDLAEMLGDKAGAREPLTLVRPTFDGKFLESDRESPIVLMGDSHTLVFHDGLLGEHAGLPDRLAAKLGRSLDLVAMNGGGANGARIALARRRDNLAGKKFVVWCFAAREFTECPQGWQRVPVIRP